MKIEDKVRDWVKQHNCEIEYVVAGDYQDCIEGKLQIEILAPDGFTFDGDLHSLICFGWLDAWHRIEYAKLEREAVGDG